MTRASLLLLFLSAGMVCGCGHDKKSKSDEEKTKLADAQREAQQNPDKFESSDDPPLKPDTHFAAGQLQESQGDLNAAIAQYQAALKVDPKHKNSIYRLGVVYTTMRRFPQAIAMWQRYLAVTNNSPAAYNNLALCYEQAMQITEAEQTFKVGIARDPDERACRINYGLMLARQGRMDEARSQLKVALKPAEVEYDLGSIYDERGKSEEAKACYRKALELDPNLTDAKTRLDEMKK